MSYDSEVLADSPIARYRLNDAAPVGAGSVVDSVASYEGTPNGTITWAQPGPLSDGTSAAAKFDGTTGYVAGGAAVASALMLSATWTVELWFSTEATNAGVIFAAAADTTHRVSITHFGNRVSSTSTVGGNKGGAATSTGTWRHVVLTSAGDLYINGVAQVGTNSSSTNAANQLTIGALNNGASFFNGRVAEVALYTTVLSSARAAAHFASGSVRTLPPGRTFLHDFEQDNPSVFPAGSDDTSKYMLGAVRTTDQAAVGSYSAAVGGATFRCILHDNPTNQDVWAGLNQGKIRARFRYTGTLPAAIMVGQITGKDFASLNDTNDGIQLFFSATGVSMRTKYANGTVTITTEALSTLAPDTWYEIEAKWRSDQSPYLSVACNGVTGTSTSSAWVGGFTCNAWHHLLLGNDLSVTPPGAWIDEFEVFGSWNGSAEDITAPTVTAASINSAGDTLTVTFSEDVTGGTGFSVPGYTLGAATGSGTSRTYSITPTVYSSSTPALTYAPGNVVDTATVPNALAAFSGLAITNGSTQIAPTQPSITSASTKSGQVGIALSYTITATGTAPITFGVSGTLPAGVTFDGANTISGTPTTAGESVVSITAANAFGSVESPLTFTISPPTLTGYTLAGPAMGQIGKARTFTIGAYPSGSQFTGTEVFTPVNTGLTGSFSAATVTPEAGSSSVLFQFTGSAASSGTIGVTDDQDWADPAAIPFTVAAPSSSSGGSFRLRLGLGLGLMGGGSRSGGAPEAKLLAFDDGTVLAFDDGAYMAF